MEESMIDIFRLQTQTTTGANGAAIDPSFAYVIIGGQPIYTSPPSKNFKFRRKV